MEKGLIARSYLSEIADAIRRKTKTFDKFKVSEMAGAIEKIECNTNIKDNNHDLIILKEKQIKAILLDVCVMKGEVLQ